MRTWRVGSISMAVALIAGGVSILLSTWSQWDMSRILMLWWPIIFILLGIEILLYIQFSRQENFKVRYDMLSIVFIGLLGMGCLLLVALTSTGVMNELQYVVHADKVTRDLPVVERHLDESIQKIVVQANEYLYGPIRLHQTERDSVHIFGTYQSDMNIKQAEQEEQALTAEEITKLYTIGDTLYISLKPVPAQTGLLREQPRMNVNLVLPENREVELVNSPNRFVQPQE